MKNNQCLIVVILLCSIFWTSCEKPEEVPQTYYDCNFSNFVDNSSNHPNAATYQSILEDGQKMNIAEAASGKTLEQLYKEKVFNPLNLESAWYSESQPIPAGTVRGYAEIYGNGQFTETEFLYKDELITADGGIIINVYDLARFIEGLYGGELISQTQLNEMMDWEDIPSDWTGPVLGHNRNGQGFEYFSKDYGDAIGHTGGVDGFSTTMLYFPEKDFTYIYFQNSVGESDASSFIYEEFAKVLFN